MHNVIFIHGLESSGNEFKGQLFRRVIPGCLTPDFEKFEPNNTYQVLLEKRMSQLMAILAEKKVWIIIGSSFGGLMGALYTCQYPSKVALLILLAPSLATPLLNPEKYQLINTSVVIYHGKKDNVVPLKPSRSRAEKLFLKLKYNVVDDDHMLHHTVENINWLNLINISNDFHQT